MKTAQEILKQAYSIISHNQDSSPEAVDPILLDAMEEYANQFKPISVEKELPPIGKRVIIFYNNGCQNYGHLESVFQQEVTGFIGDHEIKLTGRWSIDIDGIDKPFGFSDFYVTHWMHVPKPPAQD